MKNLKPILDEIRNNQLLSPLVYALVFVVLVGIANIFTKRIEVSSISMQPTLNNKDLILINKNAYADRLPQMGEIIVFPQPGTEGLFQKELVKRVTALPGDTIRVTAGQIFVNGIPLEEPYIFEQMVSVQEQAWFVPENTVFVLGDNRNHSTDSRSWGFVPIDSIIGRAICVYWPLSNIRSLQ